MPRLEWGLLIGAFGAYFCMYAFRKPVAAGEFPGTGAWGLDLKTALLLGQLAGYITSKFLGILVCSAMPRRHHARALVGMVLLAEVALLAFAKVPPSWRVAMMFLNGLPLGMVWGLVIRYLEGRRTSEILMAGLSASLVIASGAVKDVGRWMMMALGVEEIWMPAATGALFLLPFVFFVLLLERAPAPEERDSVVRTFRRSITGAERRRFLLRFGAGLAPLLLVYAALTAYRDFRDNYGVEIFRSAGFLDVPGLFTRIELPASLTVLAVLALLARIGDHRRALQTVYLMMGVGCAVLLLAMVLLQAHVFNEFQWMIAVGVGTYLAYVPVGSVYFERLTAAGGTPGTAVFGIYLADSLGYAASALLQSFRDLSAAGSSRLVFFEGLTWVMGFSGLLLVAASWWLLSPALPRTSSEEIEPILLPAGGALDE